MSFFIDYLQVGSVLFRVGSAKETDPAGDVISLVPRASKLKFASR